MEKKRELNLFGIQCKKRMIEVRISQKVLAEKVGSTDKYLDLIFHGERSGAKYVYKIAKILDINLEKLEKTYK